MKWHVLFSTVNNDDNIDQAKISIFNAFKQCSYLLTLSHAHIHTHAHSFLSINCSFKTMI